MINTAVVLICFNRPKETARVLEKIKKVKPNKLFIIMDGPRNEKDKKKCQNVKNLINKISWNCKIYKNFSDKNLGLKKRIVSGLNWVFDKVDRAIILEDDCLPNESFFYFCEKLLLRFKKNKLVKFITGNNFQKIKTNNKESYYFSKYSHIWGWATWKDTWKLYCDNNRVWEKYLVSKSFEKICLKRSERKYWKSMFEQVKLGKLKSWSIYLLFSIWKNKGLTVTPNVNLVKNLGFNKYGTNTKKVLFKNNVNYNIPKKLIHPKKIFQNLLADEYVFENIYNQNSRNIFYNLLKKIFI